jgi:hypothetical protein
MAHDGGPSATDDSRGAPSGETACKVCGAALTAGRECSYCAHCYCAEHRLPENHDCAGVKGLDAVGKRFDSGFDPAAEFPAEGATGGRRPEDG